MKVDLCRHIKTNGLQCHGVALTGSVFCYFHSRLHRSHDLYRDKVHFQSSRMMAHPFVLQLPAIEDRESAQLAISSVINALATGCIDRKDANSLFYGLQLASANARGLRIVRRPTQLVREVYKEAWTAIPEADPDLAPPGRTCEIEDPAESKSADLTELSLEAVVPPVSTRPLEMAAIPLQETVIPPETVMPVAAVVPVAAFIPLESIIPLRLIEVVFLNAVKDPGILLGAPQPPADTTQNATTTTLILNAIQAVQDHQPATDNLQP